jgi:hypothetical protein
MLTTEAEFLTQVLQLATLYRWRTAHFRPGRTATGWRTALQGDAKGWPDVVFVRERIIFAELKRDSRAKATPEQQAWRAALTQAGAEVYVWTPADWSEIERVLVGL